MRDEPHDHGQQQDGDEGESACEQGHREGAQGRGSERAAVVSPGGHGEQDKRKSTEKSEGHHRVIIMAV